MTNEWSYITAAYALTWLTLGGYALYLWRRARRAERALASDGRTARGGVS